MVEVERAELGLDAEPLSSIALLDEPRLFTETGVAARVAEICAPALRDLGYRLVRIKILTVNGCTVQIMAERSDGNFSIEDCEAASRALSPVFDVHDPIDKAYFLEMSSPGIDRPLMRASDFRRWRGHEAKIALNGAIEGRRRLRGNVQNVERDGVMIELAADEIGTPTSIHVPFALMSEAKLVLTDTLINDSLRRNAKPIAETDTSDDINQKAASPKDRKAQGQNLDTRRKRNGR